MEHSRFTDDILSDHIIKEEANAKAAADRMQRIEEDLRPLKKMYHAVLGAGAVLGLLLATLLFIYQSDKESIGVMQKSIRETQDSILKQGAQMEKLLYMHQELEKDLRREIAHAEKRR